MEQLKQMNRLSEVNSNQGIKFSHKAACPGSHCPMHTALSTAKRIEGLSTLVIGMAECGYYSRFVMDSPKGNQGELHYVYEMDSNEVVFGCREGLMHAIKQMDQEGARVILLIMTCIPALIGEDPESIIEELEGQIESKIIFFDGAHFKRNGYQSGFYETFEQLANVIERPQNSSFEESISINVFGSFKGEEFDKLKEQLKKKEVVINEYELPMSLRALSHATNAKLSFVTSKKMYKLAKRLWTRFQIPFLCSYNSYDSHEIKDTYLEVLKALSIRPEESYLQFLEEQEIQLKEKEQQIKGMSYLMNHPELDAIALSVYLAKLGMKPVLLHIEEITQEDLIPKQKLTDQGINPYVTYVTNEKQLDNSFLESQIEFIFGNCGWLKKIKRIPSKNLNRVGNLSGFARSLELLKLIVTAVEGEI